MEKGEEIMPELKIIHENDIPEFDINPAKIKREAKRKAAEEAEKGRHHIEIRKPQAEVRLFSMDTHLTHYYGIHVDVSSISLKEFERACNKAYLGKIAEVEVIVIQFKGKKLAFYPENGREI
jgi:hypothetical protein